MIARSIKLAWIRAGWALLESFANSRIPRRLLFELENCSVSHRIFYAAGPGNVILAHQHWRAGENDPTQVSMTFSSQVEEFCRLTDSSAYIVAYNGQKNFIRDGKLTLEHRPKPILEATGLLFHLSEMLYGLSLAITALKFRSTVAVIESGTAHYFLGAIYRLAGIKVVTLLHNTLWPRGYPPTRLVPKMVQRLDSLFFRWGSSATIGVSPECIRQVDQLTRGNHNSLFEIRAQFLSERFENVGPPPAPGEHPFRITYIGRVVRAKGVFDVLEIARMLDNRAPGRVQFELCGAGPDLDALKERHRELGLGDTVTIRGWVPPAELCDVYARSHASIVPTTSAFAEGLAMTAAEAVLAGRPVITNAVVPALEILRPASVEAETNDVKSYVNAILKLIDSPSYYRSLCEACLPLQRQFYDRDQGLTAVLGRVFHSLDRETG
jgi:glycogen synthase